MTNKALFKTVVAWLAILLLFVGFISMVFLTSVQDVDADFCAKCATATSQAQTGTPVYPTFTPIPPTATNTAVPTNTVQPTNTAVPTNTNTAVPTSTNTAVPTSTVPIYTDTPAWTDDTHDATSWEDETNLT